MPEQVCYLREGFNMYEMDPGMYGRIPITVPSPQTNFRELVMFISSGTAAWDLFLTSRGLFYIARLALKLSEVPRPVAFSLATMSYVKR